MYKNVDFHWISSRGKHKAPMQTVSWVISEYWSVQGQTAWQSSSDFMPLNHGNCFSSTTNTNHTNMNHQKTPGTTFPPRISCLLFFQTLPFLFHLAAFRLPIDIRLGGVEIWKQTKPYTAFADFKRPGLGDWNIVELFFGMFGNLRSLLFFDFEEWSFWTF